MTRHFDSILSKYVLIQSKILNELKFTQLLLETKKTMIIIKD